ncbi:EamA family transporter RarD [Altererythrobacter sp. KTW20L]|uniref:EamA family transporter RarD n=1 Tax=Altererythrobacter sp. KTW20L TaxID=2942210 RepID=UPI0020C10778|nr:EamA family transporter RarD [Altererythrobacter sp. KTW20L]MCL6250642.1 EamA family transporter RarD [Altererythrobacter sp. KTW20L]
MSTAVPAASPAPAPISQKRGLLYALGAHATWGSMPLYLMLVETVPALEFVAWRLVFTLPLCLLIVAARSGFADLRRVLGNGRTMLTLLGSSTLIAINWFLYVHAIQTGHVYAASLGYYILPLVMMLLGLVFLGEKLTRLQWAAVAIAGAGVAALAAGALSTLWLSLSMGVTFGFYGLLRKTVAAGPLTGLTVESMILVPVALVIVGWHAASAEGTAMAQGLGVAAAVAFSGPMTAVPLLMFASATRAMPYTVIGFLQFLSPTVVFLMGLFVFNEELKPAQLACFVAIWAAAALFTVGLFTKPKAVVAPPV